MATDIFYCILWILIMITLGLLYYPIVFYFFGSFFDRGYAVSKVIGILLLSYTSWILASAKLLPFTYFTLWLILFIQLFINIKYIGSKPYKYLAKNYKLFLLEEALFIVFFIFMIIFRSEVPKIEGIEKIMDFGILNSILRSTYMPPEDVWYSGYPTNYYYFGHYGIAVITKLSQIPSAIAYNIAVANVFALSLLGAFWLSFNFTKSYLFGLFSSVLLGFTSNLDFFYKKIILSKKDYFYADARNLIPYTINEFTAYSFLIGDLHAHILNIPFVLAFLGLLVQISNSFLSFITKNRNVDPNFCSFDTQKLIIRKNLKYYVFASLMLGAFFVTNSWDFLIYSGLFGIIVFFFNFVPLLNVKGRHEKKSIRSFKKSKFFLAFRPSFYIWFSVYTASFLLFFPFYLKFDPPTFGFGIVHDRSPASALFIMFGLFLLGAVFYVCYLVTELKKHRVKVLDIFNKHRTVLFVPTIILLYAIVLIFIPEIVFVKDIYFKANPPYFRANTVFKVWYQSWILFCVTIPFLVFYSITVLRKLKLMPKILGVLWISLFLSIVSYSSYYGFYSLNYIFGDEYDYKGLDGTSHLSTFYPDEKRIIDWLNNKPDKKIVLQATGQAYTTDSIVSAYTGFPTVVGWSDHEFGWRGSFSPIALRMGDIEIMYTSTNDQQVKTLLKKYNIKYAVITHRERKKYGESAGETLRSIATESFDFGTETVLAFE